ncbi:hypothetical protein [Blastococcus sp. PRF04-17]|uniref:hypothetical protein n=1 Tax=Blastococcus sp. PRF04-17 TaxID=2933797 RepID=UPI001FF32BFC|nr:hypothetical protein [Blastococcus sp. PRF04-17]UOY02375.1 hypothetical protein MVA48_03030 [Blastococcus sp. PRF04-17]
MVLAPGARRFLCGALALPCAVAVASFGELSGGALLVVAATGLLVAGTGVAARAGEVAPAVGRRGLPWAAWLVAAAGWELVTLLHDDLPSVSDLADPLLSHPAARATATVLWLAAGAWLVTRPRGPVTP